MTRALMGALTAVAVVAASAGKAAGQGLVEYALILVLVITADGPVVRDLQTSSMFDEDCQASSSSDFAAVCSAVAAIEAGMSGAEALARLKRTGGVLVGVAGAQSGPPTTVIRADPEPLGVVGTFPAPPFQPIVDVLIQAVSDDGAVSLVGCDVSTKPLAAFVQTRDDDGKDLLLRPDTGLDAEPCADAVQGQLLLRHEASHVVQEVEPVPNARGIRTRTGLLLPFDDDAGASAEVPVEGLAFNYVKI